jgi:hypothetical protein
MQNSWIQYYQNTKNRPPSLSLVRALNYVEKKDAALDLGSGALNESLYLVDRGYGKVVAIDKEQIPEEFLNKITNNQFQFIHSTFDQFDFIEKNFNLINANFSLPFNPPSTFSEVWNRMANSLVFGGIFVGQFFGVHDEWNKPERNMSFHTTDQIKEFLSNFEIIEFNEVEKDGTLADGSHKHWHVFHVIAKKKKP